MPSHYTRLTDRLRGKCILNKLDSLQGSEGVHRSNKVGSCNGCFLEILERGEES